jgi:hypothetical protein
MTVSRQPDSSVASEVIVRDYVEEDYVEEDYVAADRSGQS